MDELSEPSYGFNGNTEKKDSKRAAKGTRRAKAMGLYVNDDNQCSTYFTRTAFSEYVMSVDSKGGFVSTKPGRTDIGVRPVMRVRLDELHLTSGSGIYSDPYSKQKDTLFYEVVDSCSKLMRVVD